MHCVFREELSVSEDVCQSYLCHCIISGRPQSLPDPDSIWCGDVLPSWDCPKLEEEQKSIGPPGSSVPPISLPSTFDENAPFLQGEVLGKGWPVWMLMAGRLWQQTMVALEGTSCCWAGVSLLRAWKDHKDFLAKADSAAGEGSSSVCTYALFPCWAGTVSQL